VVAHPIPFEEAQQAMAYLESGRAKGKVVLVIE
jgi:NADPH:quinone reductase-like Zn-dependent oxidoreductase